MGVSLNPKDQVKGGLVTDVDGTLVNVRFEQSFTYPNSNTTTVAAVAKLVLDDGEEFDPVFWSLGSAEEWTVSADGMEADNTKGKTGLNDNSNFAFFLRELEPAGFPLNKIGSKLSFLEGLKAHWIQKAPPARAGMDNKNARGQDRTCLIPEKIIKLPWETDKKSAAGKTATKASGTTAAKTAPAASNGAGDLENEVATRIASEVLTAIREAAAGTYAKPQWGLKIMTSVSANDSFKALGADQATKTVVQRLLKNVEFLGTQEVTIDDKGEVTVPAA